MEEEQQENMIEIKEGIRIQPRDSNYNPENNVPVEGASGYDNSEETEEESSFVSYRSHCRQMKAKDIIIEELDIQMKQLEKRNRMLKFQKQELEKEVLKLKEEAEVQIVHEVFRNQPAVNTNWQSVGSGTSNTNNQQNFWTAETGKHSGLKHSVKVARADLQHFECSCGKLCKTSGDMQYHVNVTNNRSVFRCEFCSKYYASHAYLKIHQKKFHGVIPVNQFGCWTCGNIFNSRQARKHHSHIMHPKA